MTDFVYPPIPAGKKILASLNLASSKRGVLYPIGCQAENTASGSGIVEDIIASAHFGQSFDGQLIIS